MAVGLTLSYIYDTGGQKRKLSISNGGESTLYEGAFEYSDAGLPQRISTDEGQLIKVGSSWQWQYYVRDHLNNVRLVLDGAGQVVQETDYYPLGWPSPRILRIWVGPKTIVFILYLMVMRVGAD